MEPASGKPSMAECMDVDYNDHMTEAQISAGSRARPTLGLAMIMKDEVDDLNRILADYGVFFDKIFLTVTDEATHRQLKKRFAKTKTESALVDLSYFEWRDHFGATRRFNQRRITTDYWMWLDMDDEIEHAASLDEVIAYMKHCELDGVMLKHVTFQNERGQSEGTQWRERLIRLRSGFEWENVRIHETIVAPPGRTDPYAKTAKLPQVTIIHHTSVARMREHVARNMALVEQDWHETRSPRAAGYLAKTFMQRGEYDRAIPLFTYVVRHSEQADERMIMWLYIADCHFLNHDYDSALQATDQAISLDSSTPDAWYQKVLIYMALGKYDKAAQFADIALAKQPDEASVQLQDPTKYAYKAPFIAMQAYLLHGDADKALALYNRVETIAPYYIEQQQTPNINWGALCAEAGKGREASERVRQHLEQYLTITAWLGL